MVCSWKPCSTDIKDVVFQLKNGTKEILEDEFIGFYIHGSLAMGGFNPRTSDIDILVVTKNQLNDEMKRLLVTFFLTKSTNPYPVEISILNKDQLTKWKHPCPYDFHYSEFWRERIESDLLNGTFKFLNSEKNEDIDLAAHITITNHRGICIEGPPIHVVFPSIPREHYISSIMDDFHDCLGNIEKDPVYCALNLIRVYWYLKEGKISSKQEAGNWGLSSLPKELNSTIQKAVHSYADEQQTLKFETKELVAFRDYFKRNLQDLVK